MLPNPRDKWVDFCCQAVSQDVLTEHRYRIELQLAQAFLESGRGSSLLFQKHTNPYGMKFRSELKALASPVKFVPTSGESDIYCEFASTEVAVKAYWRFLDRKVYQGWRDCNSFGELLNHVVRCGYAGLDPNAQQRYIFQIVRLRPEVQHIDEIVRRINYDRANN